jgi:hypothetical protein
LCLIWEGVSPPCSEFNDFESWKYGVEALPCEAFEFICTLLCMANASLIVGSVLIRRLLLRLSRMPERLPAQVVRGLPQASLETLPVFYFVDGSAGAEALASTSAVDAATCSICIEDFSIGDRLRQLPCSHTFHASCVDAWLREKATCPLRCPDDLWTLTQPSRAREDFAGALVRESTRPEGNVAGIALTTLGRSVEDGRSSDDVPAGASTSSLRPFFGTGISHGMSDSQPIVVAAPDSELSEVSQQRQHDNIQMEV